MRTSTSSRSVSRAVALVGLLALGATLAACGSTGSSSPPASTTTTTQAGTTTTTTGSSSTTVSSLSQLVESAKTATFSATYTYNNGASTQTITYAQSPPNSLFKTSAGSFLLSTGTTSYFCGAGHCVSTNSSTDPLATLAYLFNGKTFQETAAAYAVSATVLAAAGVTLHYSTGTYAGQASNCVTIHVTKGTTSTATWCVAQNGIMDYWSAGSSSFTLTTYSSSPPASDFTLPAGDTVSTI